MFSNYTLKIDKTIHILKPVVIPEKPEIKQLTGTSTLDMETVNKTSFWITVIQLPLIFLAGVGTYFIVTGLNGFKQDVNIGKKASDSKSSF